MCGNALVTYSLNYKLPLSDGTRIFMDWHHYCGPTFYYDKVGNREIKTWWENSLICDALDWFIKRGEIA